MIEKYHLRQNMPPRVHEHLQRGTKGLATETVKAGDPCIEKTHNVIVAGIRQALLAAHAKAGQLGYETKIIAGALQGEAREAAHVLAKAALDKQAEMKPGEKHCLLSGGETTVSVRGTGMGGRNQELALAFALEIENSQGVSLLSAGTDGTDGPNDAAGAWVNGSTAALARQLKIDPRSYLDNNDSYNFFQDFDKVSVEQSHLKTGPTGTNVMDMQIMLLNKREQQNT